MTTNYDPALSTDKDTMRFRLGDTDVPRVFLQDEEITAILTVNSDDLDVSEVACLRSIALRLARPDFRVDWLSVSKQVETATWFRQEADRKAKEYGIGTASTVTTTARDVARTDTYWGDEDVIEAYS